MSERGSKVFGCFFDVRKAFDTVWIDGLLYKLFSKFGVEGRMWLAIKTLYTGVKAQVLYSGSLSRKFDASKGTGQGRILVPFMYKVYINSLAVELTEHSFAVSINMLFHPLLLLITLRCWQLILLFLVLSGIFATNTVLGGGMNFIMIKAVLSLLEKENELSLLEKENESIVNLLTLSHLGDLIHSQPEGGAESAPLPLRDFAFLDSN